MRTHSRASNRHIVLVSRIVRLMAYDVIEDDDLLGANPGWTCE